MNQAQDLINKDLALKEATKALSKAKVDLSTAKKNAAALCPVKLNEEVPLDTGGKGRVIGINIMKIRPDFISFGVSLDCDGESGFMTMKKVIK